MPGYFVEDIVDAREILLCLFKTQFGETLLRLEACNAGGLFDNGAAIVGLRAKQLANALLLDDRVALRPQTCAHEDVLDIPQPA